MLTVTLIQIPNDVTVSVLYLKTWDRLICGAPYSKVQKCREIRELGCMNRAHTPRRESRNLAHVFSCISVHVYKSPNVSRITELPYLCTQKSNIQCFQASQAKKKEESSKRKKAKEELNKSKEKEEAAASTASVASEDGGATERENKENKSDDE